MLGMNHFGYAQRAGANHAQFPLWAQWFAQPIICTQIDKVVFAATKADHVTPEQHVNMVSLLQQMIHPAWQHAAYEILK